MRITVGRVGTNKFGVTNIKVDRTTILGNPFPMKNQSDNERTRVCLEYVKYFVRMVNSAGPFRDEVGRIYKLAKSGKSINLQCHCAPKQCHADTINKFIEKYL